MTPLEPKFSNVASFYGKALVNTWEGHGISLYSYGQCVLVISVQNNTYYVRNDISLYTQTTMRHVNEFLQQHGFASLTKAEMRVKVADGIANDTAFDDGEDLA